MRRRTSCKSKLLCRKIHRLERKKREIAEKEEEGEKKVGRADDRGVLLWWELEQKHALVLGSSPFC